MSKFGENLIIILIIITKRNGKKLPKCKIAKSIMGVTQHMALKHYIIFVAKQNYECSKSVGFYPQFELWLILHTMLLEFFGVFFKYQSQEHQASFF